MKKRTCKIILIIACILLAIVVASAIYLGNYYHADPQALSVPASASVSVETKDDGTMVFLPEEPIAGFIFYPGGKVESSAYAPLLLSLAEKGILCVMPEMPFRLAVLDINAAEGIPAQYPTVGDWYIGGHSLGGSMAASYLKEHSDEFEGLILLASYSTADLSAENIDVLSIYGSEDGVLDLEKYKENQINLPTSFSEVVIQGGNHAGFGMYGNQDGDGAAKISNEDQIEQTAQWIYAFVSEK